MKKLLLTSFAAAALLASPAMEGTAEAGAAACAKGIVSCVDALKKHKGNDEGLGDKIENAKAACAQLKGCKKDCRSDTKSLGLFCKGDGTRAEIKDCKSYVKANHKSCKSLCKIQYKTDDCINARKETVGAIVNGVAKCASGIAKCTPATYVACLEGVSYCASKAPKIAKDIKEMYADVAKRIDGIKKDLKDHKKELGGSKGACKAYRTAKKDCKNAKKACKKICKKGDKDEKKGCIAECKGNKDVCISQLTDQKGECKKRRRKIGGQLMGTIVQAANDIRGIAKQSKKVKKAYETLLKCKMKLSACSAI